DIDIIKARAKNEYRLSKVRGEAMISVRIPGGILPAHLLTVARAPKLVWVQRHEPDIFRQIDKVLLPKDFLRLRMTGVFASDMSD
ncbi:FGGY family carbohydrate kinase, partial [Salmonella enterica subsp. enterica serovar Kentucky]|nr:FGGY family carbohydrate kinase [Salmonella enterica subsp. enterica serovar Kentucky]